MILRIMNDTSCKLTNSITLKEFITDIIEKDNERYLKLYRIHFVEEMNKKNMILYYQDGVLKSHHTSLEEFNYLDFLDYLIEDSYGVEYISSENIISFKLDSTGHRSKMKDMKQVKKRQSEIFKNKDKIFEKLERESISRERKNKVLYGKGDINTKDIEEAVREMLWDEWKRNNELYQLDHTLTHLEEENIRLNERIKWLEYKMELLINKNISNETEIIDSSKPEKKKLVGIKNLGKYRR